MVEVEWLDNDEAIITVTARKWFGYGKEITKRYRGGCTVWFSYPEGKRQGTGTEIWLSNIWEKSRWERDDKK